MTIIIIKTKVLHIFLSLRIPCKWLILGQADVRDRKSLSLITVSWKITDKLKKTRPVVFFLFFHLYAPLHLQPSVIINNNGHFLYCPNYVS